MKGILLDGNDGLAVRVARDTSGKITGGLVVGESKMQDAYLVLKSCRGDFKEDPVLGAGLLLNIRGRHGRDALKKAAAVSLMRVGIDFEDIKNDLRVIINKENINIS